MSEPINSYPRSGPMRGLLRLVRDHYGQDSEWPCKGRGLIGHASGRKRGTCRWCHEPCSPRANWHTECARWFLAAKGSVSPPHGESHKGGEWERWIEPNGRRCIACAVCRTRGYDEVDHHDALSIAWERRGRGDRRWWRAWTPMNLRPLCQPCHAVKTRHDRARLARLRAGTPGPGPGPDPDYQRDMREPRAVCADR